jgi:hypothetical protein
MKAAQEPTVAPEAPDLRWRVLCALTGAHRLDDFAAAVRRAASVEGATPEALRAIADALEGAADRNEGVEFDDLRARHTDMREAKAARQAAEILAGGAR